MDSRYGSFDNLKLVRTFVIALLGCTTLCAVSQTIDYVSYYTRNFSALTSLVGGGGTLWSSPRFFKVLSTGDSIEFDVPVRESGFWNITLEYEVLSQSILPPEVSVSLNGEVPFLEASAVALQQLWAYNTFDFPKNRYGDEIVPNQVPLRRPITYALQHSTGIFDTPLWFHFRAPMTKLKLTVKRGQIGLRCVFVNRPRSPVPHRRSTRVASEKGAKLTIEAEKPLFKTDTTHNAVAVRDVSVRPYETHRLVLNTFGGSSWKSAGQAVTYSFYVQRGGAYKVAFKYRNDRPNFVSFRKMYVDGEVPFAELERLGFRPTSGWLIWTPTDGTGAPIELHLEAGTHTLALEVNVSVYQDVLLKLRELMSYINTLALKVRYITAGRIDRNVEWEIEEYSPGIRRELSVVSDELKRLAEVVLAINGGLESQEVVSINVARMLLERFTKNPDQIPNRLDALVGSTGSVLSELSNAYSGLQDMPLQLDEIYVYSGTPFDGPVRSSPLKVFWEGLKRFIASFVVSTEPHWSVLEGRRSLRVWVNRPRQYVDIIQEMVDRDFTPRTRVHVHVSILRDEQKLILANAAKKSPDVAIGISNWIPYEMGIRGAALDLKKFPDFGQFVRNFHPGSLLPYLFEGKCFGLPETLDFYVLFYRRDILDFLRIPVPETWEDVKLILPELQRNGMNFYIPLSAPSAFKPWMATAPFIFQYHGELFGEDGLIAALDTPNTIKAIDEMTKLYTLYGLPPQVANFFESFRRGEIPIGVGNLQTYVQLHIAAPELRGLWGIAPSPGVRHGGTIERWQTGSAQAVAIFADTKHPDEAWEFVKWWLSPETQAEFVNKVVNNHGFEFLIVPSSVKALTELPFEREHLSVLEEQFRWLHEVPKMPASYILERELSNVWNKVVLQGKVLRVAVDDAVTVVNKEIARKLEEFGYFKDGKPVRPFKIYKLSDVREWYR